MTFQRGYETDRCTIGTGVHTYSRDRTTELLLFKVSGHFVQRPFRTKETIWSPSYNDFLYELVPGFLHTHAKESFRTRILYTRILIYFYNEIRTTSMLFLSIIQSIEK